MKYHFNLIDEAWIPCIFNDGRFEYCNIKKTLLSATEIRQVQAELPPMTASLLMLLLAVLYRSLGIESEDDWIDCWDKGIFNPQRINHYLDEWHERFDLFDTKHPFYQDPLLGKRPQDIEKLKGKELAIKTVSELLLHASSGDAATLFDHHTDDMAGSYALGEMARLLLMIQGFSLGGMTSAAIAADRYYKDSAHGRGVVIFLQAENLFKTLLLNLIAPQEMPYDWMRNKTDKPAWEWEDPLEDGRCVPAGMADFLTWQSRRVLLQPAEKAGQVTIQHLYPAPGLSLPEEFLNPFYSISFRETSSGKLEKKLLRFSEDKALWRDSVSLFESRSQTQSPPCSLPYIKTLQRDGIIDSQINLLALGLCSQPGQKKAYFYRAEQFSYPHIYLKDPGLRAALNRCLDQALNVNRQLWGALNKMAGLIIANESDLSEGRKPDPNDSKNLINHWDGEAYYWRNLENPFFHLVNSLPQDASLAERSWQETLRRQALSTFDQAEAFCGANVAAFKAGSKARRQLFNGLKKILILDEEEGS